MQKEKNKKIIAGFATIELLIAFAVLIINITGILLLSVGNGNQDGGTGKIIAGGQLMSIKNETNQEALYLAEQQIEDAKLKAQSDFNSINTTSDQSHPSGLLTFTKKFSVSDLTLCKKLATSSVVWNLPASKEQKISLSTLLSDTNGTLALGGDCATDSPSTNWDNPQTFTAYDIEPGGNQGTDIDVINIKGHKFAFLTSTHSNANSNDFWVFDLETSPVMRIGINTGAGLNALDVAKDVATGDYYAFAVQNKNTNQLQIIKVTDPMSPVLVKSISLPNITFTCSPASDPCLAGQSIFFYNNRIFIGTKYIANLTLPTSKNNEFHVYCVTDTTVSGCSPTNPIWLGSYNVNHNVNSIAVSGNKAYLATSGDNQEITILDVTNPSAITSLPNFDAPGDADGTSITVLGNKIYLGRVRTSAGQPELCVLDKENLSLIFGIDLNLNPSSASVKDIVVASNYIFLGTSDSSAEFQVWNIDSMTSRWSYFNFPQAISGIEYLDDKIYVAAKSNNALHIIYDQP